MVDIILVKSVVKNMDINGSFVHSFLRTCLICSNGNCCLMTDNGRLINHVVGLNCINLRETVVG